MSAPMEYATVNTYETITEDTRFCAYGEEAINTDIHGFGHCQCHDNCLAASNINTAPLFTLSPLSNFVAAEFVAALPVIHSGSKAHAASVIMLLASEADPSYYAPGTCGLEELEEFLGLHMLEDFGVPEVPVCEDEKEIREATVYEVIEDIRIAPHCYRRAGLETSTRGDASPLPGEKRTCPFDNEHRAHKRQKLEDYRAPYLELMQPGISLSIDVQPF